MLLLSAINSPESVKGIKPYMAACAIVQTIELSPPKRADGQSEEDFNILFHDWLVLKREEVEFTESQRDVAKVVITKCAESGVLPKTRYLTELISAFGLDS